MSEQDSAEPIIVHGAIDLHNRCVHYHSAVDVVAVRMKCCGRYYACKECHTELAGHPATLWPRSDWHQLAVLCGVCRRELSINEYLACGSRCPNCSAAFNPNCRIHHHFYFEPA